MSSTFNWYKNTVNKTSDEIISQNYNFLRIYSFICVKNIHLHENIIRHAWKMHNNTNHDLNSLDHKRMRADQRFRGDRTVTARRLAPQTGGPA